MATRHAAFWSASMIAVHCCIWNAVCGAQIPTLAMGLDPQSYVVQWGPYAYDTRSRDGRLRKVVCGLNNTAHLRSDGRLFVQGVGGSSAPGTQWTSEVPPLPANTHYTDVALNGFCGMAIRSDGHAVGWGWFGATGSPPAEPPLPSGLTYTRVALSGAHGLLLRSDGVVVAFGNNSMGQCNVPPFPAGAQVVAMRASALRSSILMSDGTVLLWGDNQFGQCNAPSLPPGVVYTALGAQQRPFTLLLRSDGLIEAFGSNANGECNVPPLPPGMRYDYVGAGDAFGVAVRSDNTFVVWGAATTSFGLGSPPSIPAGLRCSDLDVGQGHVAARLSDGSVLSWGHDDFYDHYVPYRAQPGQPPRKRVVHVSSGVEHSLMTFSDGTIEGFGSNIGGQLNLPPAPPGLRYVRGEAGGVTSLALLNNGTIVGVGYNGFGALNIPPLPAGMTFTDMAVEHGHSVVIRSDGNAFAFGDNTAGQCNVPPLPLGVTYRKASVNENRTVLLRSDGTLAYCGTPYFGSIPSPPSGTRFIDIAAAGFFAVALASNNTVVAWGSLGGPNWVQLQPLPSGVYYVAVHGGYWSVIFRRSDGQIDVMGENSDHGANIPPPEPGTSCVQVSGVSRSPAARMSATCTYTGFGTGCAGSMSPTRLIPSDTPRIGRTLVVTLRNLPSNLAALGMGFQRPAVPIPLAAIGMPGCDLRIQVDAVALLSGLGSEASFQLPIPDLPSLVGVRFQHQALVLDPGAGNAMGAVISDAMEGVIGYP